jgi:hypothetical protein
MGDGCDGGGLGGKRGGDCGRDLSLKGCGGIGVCHPKKKTRNCGLEFAQAAAAAENGKRGAKGLSNPSANWRNCGWSETQQLHSKHNTKRTMIQMTSQPVEFSQKPIRK